MWEVLVPIESMIRSVDLGGAGAYWVGDQKRRSFIEPDTLHHSLQRPNVKYIKREKLNSFYFNPFTAMMSFENDP